MYAIEDIHHTLMQCPAMAEHRIRMYANLRKVLLILLEISQGETSKVFGWLLGGNINGIDFETMSLIWQVSGNAVYDMYSKVVNGRTCVEYGLP